MTWIRIDFPEMAAMGLRGGVLIEPGSVLSSVAAKVTKAFAAGADGNVGVRHPLRHRIGDRHPERLDREALQVVERRHVVHQLA